METSVGEQKPNETLRTIDRCIDNWFHHTESLSIEMEVFFMSLDNDNSSAGINSLRPSDAYMRRWTGPSLVQTMASRPVGAKPLSEPMLEYCQFEP